MMQFTAYTIADLWKDGHREFYLYEITKTDKVIKHRIRDLVEFDSSVVIAIGDDTSFPKHRLVFSPGGGTKRMLGESIFYTDFSAVKSKFNSKNGLKEVAEEIANLEKQVKSLSDLLRSRKEKRDRLLAGMGSEQLSKLDEEDKELKAAMNEYLKKTIYHYAARYGSDLSYTFLIDRIWQHKNDSIPENITSKDELGKVFEQKTNEELKTILDNMLLTEKQ